MLPQLTARLFADDTICHKDIDTEDDLEDLKEDLNKLAKWEKQWKMATWEKQWKMAFHPKKCTALQMTRHKTTFESNFTLHGQRLESEHQARYLGVTVTADLPEMGDPREKQHQPCQQDPRLRTQES